MNWDRILYLIGLSLGLLILGVSVYHLIPHHHHPKKEIEPVDYALTQLGIAEYGTDDQDEYLDNPTIDKYIEEFPLGYTVPAYATMGEHLILLGHLTDSVHELAHKKWCGFFIAYCCKKTGYLFPEHPRMDEWLLVGEPVEHPKRGDIVVLKTHVAFFWDRYANGTLVLLSGSQGVTGESPRVCFIQHKIEDGDIEAFIRPVKQR